MRDWYKIDREKPKVDSRDLVKHIGKNGQLFIVKMM